MTSKKALILGITSQDGYYLHELLTSNGYDILVLDRKEFDMGYPHKIRDIIKEYKPDEIYNLIGYGNIRNQEYLEMIWKVNGLGIVAILESIRQESPKTKLFNCASSYMYGDTTSDKYNEETPFSPTDYINIARLYAYRMCNIYRKSYGLFISTGILFNHICCRTPNYKIVKRILNDDAKDIDTNSYTDFGFAKDFVEAMYLSMQQKVSDNYVIGTGELHSLKEIAHIMDKENIILKDAPDIKGYCADISKAESILGWKPKTLFKNVIEDVMKSKFNPVFDSKKDAINISMNNDLDKRGSTEIYTITNIDTCTNVNLGNKKEIIDADMNDTLGNKKVIINADMNDTLGNKKVIDTSIDTTLKEKSLQPYSHKEETPKVAIISGITGQDGRIMSELLIEKGYTVIGLIRTSARDNIQVNEKVILEECDLLETDRIYDIIIKYKPDEFYNFAAQSFVQYSFTNPEYTAQVDGFAVCMILEAIRKYSPHTRFYQAGTSEMFGNSGVEIQGENTPFNPCSPYAAAKEYAHGITKLYREKYGLFAVEGVLFNHESEYRSTRFITKKVIDAALNDKLLRVGNIFSKRDWGYAREYMNFVWQMLQKESPKMYVICTGETHSVKEFIEESYKRIKGITISWNKDYTEGIDSSTGKICVLAQTSENMRPDDLTYLCGKCSEEFNSTIHFSELIDIMRSK